MTTTRNRAGVLPALTVLAALPLAAALASCRSETSAGAAGGPEAAAAGEPAPSSAAGTPGPSDTSSAPATGMDARAAGAAADAPAGPVDAAVSPRHGEYVMYATAQGDSVRAFVVYPERPDAAPGLIVIHEVFGLTEWIRSVADRYAEEGFIAIAPDLLWGLGPQGGGTDGFPDEDAAIAAIRELPPDVVKARLDGARGYLRLLPASSGKVGTVGFCWGGHQSFQYATNQPDLGAAVVFYGSGPEPVSSVGAIRAPVLGLYGGDDSRVNASIPEIERAMADAGRAYEKEIYRGAGHGFLREDQEEANAAAASKAWRRSLDFLERHLGSAAGGSADSAVGSGA